MISAISKALANLLAIETSLDESQIDLNPPSLNLIGKAALNIYCYNYCESDRFKLSSPPMDLAFMISTWNMPISCEQALLTEILSCLRKHRQLENGFLPPEFAKDGALVVEVNAIPAIEPVVLWESLDLEVRPALYLTVKLPLDEVRAA